MPVKIKEVNRQNERELHTIAQKNREMEVTFTFAVLTLFVFPDLKKIAKSQGNSN